MIWRHLQKVMNFVNPYCGREWRISADPQWKSGEKLWQKGRSREGVNFGRPAGRPAGRGAARLPATSALFCRAAARGLP
jgi:hypothetical protein